MSQRLFSSISYVGMGAVDAKFSSWVLTNTLENDNLTNLSSFYGTSPQDICAANGVPWTSDAVNQWVLSKGGKCLPYQKGQPKVAGCPDGGWAVFRNGNKILLPNKNRPGVSPVTQTPPTKSVPTAVKTNDTNWAAWGMAALAVIAIGTSIYSSTKKGRI